MTIITISRQYGSGGDEIASRICEILGYKQFDKRLMAQAAREAGLSDQEVVDFSEENHKVSSFLDRLFGRSEPIARTRYWKEDAQGARMTEEVKLTEDIVVALVQKAVRSAYQAGNLVIVGRGGQVILKDQPGVIHVRIEAPLEERIQRVKQEIKQTRLDFHADVEIRREAQDRIIERDAASMDYLKRYYQVDWNDPLLYHLVLNIGRMSIEQAAKTIVNLVYISQAEQKSEGQPLPEPSA